VRKKTPQKSIRMYLGGWNGGERLFHGQNEATKLKACWGKRLNALAAILKENA